MQKIFIIEKIKKYRKSPALLATLLSIFPLPEGDLGLKNVVFVFVVLLAGLAACGPILAAEAALSCLAGRLRYF